MFGSDHYGMRPDIITIAKGLTSAYAPLSGSIVGNRVWEVLERGADELGVLAMAGPIRHICSARRRASPISSSSTNSAS